MLENVLTVEIAVLSAFATCYFLYQTLFKPGNLPSFAIAGAKEGDWFPYFQAKIRNTADGQNAVFSAYKQHREEPCFLPFFGTPRGTVVLPLNWIKSILSQPDHVLNLYDVGVEMLQLEYAFLDKRFNNPPLHINLISKDLTKNYGDLIPDMMEDIKVAFTEQWGRSDEWTTVTVYDTVQKILGLPLRPLVAPLITLPHRLSLRRFRKIVVPEIQKRLADSNRGDTKAQQNDFLQWAIQQAKEFEDPYFSRPEVLASRALFANYISIHTSTFSFTDLVLDLAMLGPQVQEELRQEIVSVLASCDGKWSKKALAKMEKLDSLLRESARVNTFMSGSSNRFVTAPEGLALPNGQTLPKDTPIIFFAAPVMLDETYYPDPYEFQPFRFAPKATDDGDGGDDETGAQDGKRARTAFACTSPEYLAFGHGKHACPGRFFAAAELKLMAAHILLEYELEKIERPASKWYSIVRLPSMTYELKIRRRL
ncbi:cytochrome P450 [Pyricularia oryzae Y34]|uniref:Cytochrome P450 n=2 Tax=Pyricularia oryzae TaxID=318829 RepID=A0AA97NLN2_PYRO3|nr:cytochrome P450 [Pyricularia oryzae Y34]